MLTRPCPPINLMVNPGPNGLPTRSPLELQGWITQQAQIAIKTAPPPELPRLAPVTVGALLKAIAGG